MGLTKWVDRVFIKGGLGWIIHGPENIGWAWCVSCVWIWILNRVRMVLIVAKPKDQLCNF